MVALLGPVIAEAAPVLPAPPQNVDEAQAGPSDQPDVQLSVQADRTTIEVGEQLMVTITIAGDIQRVELSPFTFPEAFRVVAQSRSTNLSMELGQVRRSVSLVYALMALTPGEFELGPFTVHHRGKPLLTDPVEIVVQKPVLPPKLDPAERFVL